MAGSTLGHLFRITTFGESHGPAIGAVVDGCPPGMSLSVEDIQLDLDRRKPGTSRHVTQRQEADQVEILSGVFEGKTTGTPIALVIRNTDQRSQDYGDILDSFRPGHADYTYWHKYGIRDPRGGGRSSARLTAPVVAAAAVAKKWLAEKHGISFYGYMTQLGDVEIPFEDQSQISQNPFFAPNAKIIPELEAYMDQLRKAGDSCGARLTVVAKNVPVGLGEPIFDKFDADIAHAMMGINAVKVLKLAQALRALPKKAVSMAMKCLQMVLQAITLVACWVVSAVVKMWWYRLRSNQRHQSCRRNNRSIVLAMPTWCKPKVVTILALVYAPLQSLKPCWHW